MIEFNELKKCLGGLFGMEKVNSRIWFFDNLKAFLLLFVVFGHVLELFMIGKVVFIYQLIYLVHMPLFVFCSGYMAKDNPNRVITNILYPYIIFQTLYCIFAKLCLGVEMKVNFVTPYWIMWYLLALFAWMLIFPLIKSTITSKVGVAITIIFSLFLGIVVGFEETISGFLSLSRIFYFMPFFVLGVCVKKIMKTEKFLQIISKWYVRAISAVLTLTILIWLYRMSDTIPAHWLYGSFPYVEEGYSFIFRIGVYLSAIVISIFVMSIMPRRKMFFSYIGAGTLQVYLLHGFIIRLMMKYDVFGRVPSLTAKIAVGGGIALFITFVLASRFVKIALRPLFSIDWLARLANRNDDTNSQ